MIQQSILKLRTHYLARDVCILRIHGDVCSSPQSCSQSLAEASLPLAIYMYTDWRQSLSISARAISEVDLATSMDSFSLALL